MQWWHFEWRQRTKKGLLFSWKIQGVSSTDFQLGAIVTKGKTYISTNPTNSYHWLQISLQGVTFLFFRYFTTVTCSSNSTRHFVYRKILWVWFINLFITHIQKFKCATEKNI